MSNAVSAPTTTDRSHPRNRVFLWLGLALIFTSLRTFLAGFRYSKKTASLGESTREEFARTLWEYHGEHSGGDGDGAYFYKAVAE